MKQPVWWKALPVVLCFGLLLTSCRGDAPAASNSSTASETRQTIPPEERTNGFVNDEYQYAVFSDYYLGPYGILDRSDNVLVSPTYEGIYQMTNDRFYAFPGDGKGLLIDQNGKVLIGHTQEDLQCNIDRDAAEDKNGKAVLFCADGQLYDADGGKIGKAYDQMRFSEEGMPLAKNDEGYFELDENGKEIRRLDEVQTVGSAFDGALQLTLKPDIEWNKYGAKNKDGKQILDEKYYNIQFLSPDRVVGYETVHWEDVCYPDREVVIVDSKGRIVCDRYSYIALSATASNQADIQLYPYPYLVAFVGKTTDKASESGSGWYVIDHDGNPVNKEPFAEQTKDEGALVSFLCADNRTVTYSLETGKIVE